MATPLRTEKDPRRLGEKVVNPDVAPPGGIRYPVRDFETWVSIAGKHDLDVWRLIEFNFATRNPNVVNWYLREYVGCTQVAPDQSNWQFTSGITGGRGAWRGGVIYLPPDSFTFESDVVFGQSDPILGGRLPTDDEKRAGKEFFDKIAKAAQKRAQRVSQLDESTVEKIISDAMDGYGNVDNVLSLTNEITTIEIVGELASTVMLPVGSALQVIDALREIGYSNKVKDIARRRRTYYQALAAGIASGLDPNYLPPSPTNIIFAAVFRLGQNVMRKTSVRKKRQLMFELIDHYYFQNPLKVDEKRPHTLQEYKALTNGAVFKQAIMNRFEHDEYLWR